MKQFLRCGFTTGAAAAAASKAAVIYKLFKKKPEYIRIINPNGKPLDINVFYNKDIAYVIKDGGDDIDVTDKAVVAAEVILFNGKGNVYIVGGSGIGIIAKKGLQVDVGEYAINPIPKKMIRENILPLIKNKFTAFIFLTVDDGMYLAKKTYNEKLGILGGLSILGSTGIVKPMSIEAVKETIKCEIDVLLANNIYNFFLIPGRIGKKCLDIYFEKSPYVNVSNFFDFTFDYLKDRLITEINIIGHPGKIAKMAMGHYYTHSKYAPSPIKYIADRLNINANYNTVEEIVKEGYNFDIIAIDIAERIYKDYKIKAEIYLCDMKGSLIGKNT
ncbi:MAG: cobalt-precorrin-5B (C(1))-methyltransferase CbiD [Deferribacterota bacterium]|nr:cobalt-precorrin-5B (C(1))-methyltransferase CbiD [Deferribacterota bacterium]